MTVGRSGTHRGAEHKDALSRGHAPRHTCVAIAKSIGLLLAAGARSDTIDYKKISSYSSSMPRRKPGTLLPLETEILELTLAMLRSGQETFHGFGLAQTMREQTSSRSLTAHGTLYKALGRLEEFGLVKSRWEDAATVEGRPRRRLYELTSQGTNVAERALADEAAGRSPRIAPKPA